MAHVDFSQEQPHQNTQHHLADVAVCHAEHQGADNNRKAAAHPGESFHQKATVQQFFSYWCENTGVEHGGNDGLSALEIAEIRFGQLIADRKNAFQGSICQAGHTLQADSGNDVADCSAGAEIFRLEETPGGNPHPAAANQRDTRI